MYPANATRDKVVRKFANEDDGTCLLLEKNKDEFYKENNSHKFVTCEECYLTYCYKCIPKNSSFVPLERRQVWNEKKELFEDENIDMLNDPKLKE